MFYIFCSLMWGCHIHNQWYIRKIRSLFTNPHLNKEHRPWIHKRQNEYSVITRSIRVGNNDFLSIFITRPSGCCQSLLYDIVFCEPPDGYTSHVFHLLSSVIAAIHTKSRGLSLVCRRWFLVLFCSFIACLHCRTSQTHSLAIHSWIQTATIW